MADMRRMDIGQIVDFCIEYNEAHDIKSEAEQKDKRRMATQADWDAFFG